MFDLNRCLCSDVLLQDVELKEEDLRAALDRLAGDDAVQLRAGDVIAVLPFDTDM